MHWVVQSVGFVLKSVAVIVFFRFIDPVVCPFTAPENVKLVTIGAGVGFGVGLGVDFTLGLGVGFFVGVGVGLDAGCGVGELEAGGVVCAAVSFTGGAATPVSMKNKTVKPR